jgi:hypothetical protein
MTVSSLVVAQNKLYVSNNHDLIYVIDPYQGNCDTTLIGQSNINLGTQDLALTTDGRLWTIDRQLMYGPGYLYEIDTLTANATLVGPTIQLGIQVGPALVGFNDSTILAEAQAYLYSINTNTGSFDTVGFIGHQASGDLAWYDNNLYMSSGTDLIRISVNINPLSISNVEVVNSPNNPIPNHCFGMVNISIPGEMNQLLCLTLYDLYKICPLDASWEWFCSSQVPDAIHGAASKRIPVQSPLPTGCGNITDIENQMLESSVLIRPNPFNEQATISVQGNCGNCNLKFFDTQGRLVREQNLDRNESVFHKQDLPSGIYIGHLFRDEKLIRSFKLLLKEY